MRRHSPLLVGMARSLIRPQLRDCNIDSKASGLCLHRLVFGQGGLPHPGLRGPLLAGPAQMPLLHRVPLDVELHAHADGRAAARQHLDALAPGDLAVYDRGYYSAALLHAERDLATVFRRQRNASGPIGEFIAGPASEGLVRVGPPAAAGGRERPRRPCPLRLLKYTAGGTVFTLGSTLLDAQRYPAADMAELYHGRWDVEEGYKVSKRLLHIEQFHGRSEETVKQDLYANFTLAAMARLCASECERQLAGRAAEPAERPRQPASTTVRLRWGASWKGCS